MTVVDDLASHGSGGLPLQVEELHVSLVLVEHVVDELGVGVAHHVCLLYTSDAADE